MHKKQGFTLIELLVVIAIIGLLSSIVLASLASARTKARDAAVISEMDSIKKQAELFYSNHGNYGSEVRVSIIGPGGYAYSTSLGLGDCLDELQNGRGGGSMFTSDLKNLLLSLKTNGATNIVCGTSGGGVPVTNYAISLTLPSGNFFCMDNAGTFRTAVGNEVLIVAKGDNTNPSGQCSSQ
jgi:prepilin-type N-terminal cleavage/methylation domain-containing protein